VNWRWSRLSSRARSAWLLALFLVATFAPLVAPLSSQPASRIALTAALAEHHTVDIRGYPLGIDRATYNGHLRSDKAPGQPLLAVPVYLVGRALGAQSAATLRINGNLGVWWTTLWTAFVPFVVLVALMYLIASRHASRAPALAAAFGIGVCTMMLPHAVNLYGAPLAALAAYAAWAVLEPGSTSATRCLVAGALAGVSVVAEYETVVVLVVLLVVAARRARWRACWYALGAAGPLLVLAGYQWAAFGEPWRTPHAYYATAAVRRQIVGYVRPGWRGIDATIFGSHGLLLTNVIVVIALVAAALCTRSPDVQVRRHAVIALAIGAPYIVLCILWKGTPVLEEPGPRYMIPALPFLAVPLASEWGRLRRIALLGMGLSGVVAVGAATTGILTSSKQAVLPAMVHRIVHRQFLPTVWSITFGRFGTVVYLATVALVVVALVRGWTRERARQLPEG